MRYAVTVAFEGPTMDDYWRYRQGYAAGLVDGLIVQVGGAAHDGMRIISIWESKDDHDRFTAQRINPALQRFHSPSDMTVTDFAVDNLIIGPAMPQAHRPTNTAIQDKNRRSAT